MKSLKFLRPEEEAVVVVAAEVAAAISALVAVAPVTALMSAWIAVMKNPNSKMASARLPSMAVLRAVFSVVVQLDGASDVTASMVVVMFFDGAFVILSETFRIDLVKSEQDAARATREALDVAAVFSFSNEALLAVAVFSLTNSLAVECVSLQMKMT